MRGIHDNRTYICESSFTKPLVHFVMFALHFIPKEKGDEIDIVSLMIGFISLLEAIFKCDGSGSHVNTPIKACCIGTR